MWSGWVPDLNSEKVPICAHCGSKPKYRLVDGEYVLDPVCPECGLDRDDIDS